MDMVPSGPDILIGGTDPTKFDVREHPGNGLQLPCGALVKMGVLDRCRRMTPIPLTSLFNIRVTLARRMDRRDPSRRTQASAWGEDAPRRIAGRLSRRMKNATLGSCRRSKQRIGCKARRRGLGLRWRPCAGSPIARFDHTVDGVAEHLVRTRGAVRQRLVEK